MTVTSTGTGPADAVRDCAAQGAGNEQVEIVRSASRGEDQLMLLAHADSSWWVARRVAGVTRVCAYIGEYAAERDYELFLASPSPRGEWVEDDGGVQAA